MANRKNKTQKIERKNREKKSTQDPTFKKGADVPPRRPKPPDKPKSGKKK